MNRLIVWAGAILASVVVLAATSHAATSAEAHAAGECLVCNLHSCLIAMFH